MTLRGRAVSEQAIDGSNEMAIGGSNEKETGGSNELISATNLRIFSFSELKAATRNFSRDTLLGEGGFGRVYKGWIHDKSTDKNGSGSVIAVKKLSPDSMQGYAEWLVISNYTFYFLDALILLSLFGFHLDIGFSDPHCSVWKQVLNTT